MPFGPNLTLAHASRANVTSRDVNPAAKRSVRYSRDVTHAEIEVNQQGRVTIPAQIRHDLDLHAGSRLVATVEDGRLVLEERSRLLARYQARLAAAKASGRRSGRVTDSLIADRRAEAEKESRTR